MNKIYWKVLKLFSITVAIGVSLTACGSSSWKEEVLLHDGTKIIVERSVSRAGSIAPNESGPIKEQNLSFVMPNTKQKVVWKDIFTEDIGGANFLPMMLEISKGIAYLVVYPMGCISYNKWGRPNPPYVVFKYEAKVWKRIALKELPIELKTPNLIFSSPDDEAKKSGQGVVSADKIKALYADTHQPEYKTILREPIKDGGDSGCGEMIYVGKGGWRGVDWFTKQPTYEACLKYCQLDDISTQYCPCNKYFKGNEK